VPVVVVVTEAVVAVVTVEVAVVVVRIVVVEVDVVDVVAVVVVDELQDAKTRDIRMMPVSITQMIPLFMWTSSFITVLPGNLLKNHL
jgi:hypothetical protein